MQSKLFTVGLLIAVTASVTASITVSITVAVAETKDAQTISQPNSKCVVKSTEAEFPLYKVYRNKKVIFAPKTQGVNEAFLSPSGNYLALSGGHIQLLDLKRGQFEFGVVIINCKTGKKSGYRKNQPTHITKWDGDRILFTTNDALAFTGPAHEKLP